MRVKTGKYDAFSKVFAQLSDESQDKLVKTAHRLLKTHRLVKRGRGKGGERRGNDEKRGTDKRPLLLKGGGGIK